MVANWSQSNPINWSALLIASLIGYALKVAVLYWKVIMITDIINFTIIIVTKRSSLLFFDTLKKRYALISINTPNMPPNGTKKSAALANLRPLTMMEPTRMRNDKITSRT